MRLSTLWRTQVVVSTCATAGAAPLQGRYFRMLVVDEATQATEPTTLIPLVLFTDSSGFDKLMAPCPRISGL
jgi:superfamily I DNA and/or RNA helicase